MLIDYEIILRALALLKLYWWIPTPIFLAILSWQMWQEYSLDKFLKSIKWVVLEIIPPPQVERSPKIAESLFAGVHGTYKPVASKSHFVKGEVPMWFSFEIASNGGQLSFFIRTPDNYKNVIESHIFAQYPEAEIRVVDDYVNLLPKDLPNDQYDLFGADLVFTKEDAYPIKTYPVFEDESGKDEWKQIDPLAPILEQMSSLDPGEHVWLQLIIRPTGDAWVKDSQPLIDKIVGKAPKAADKTIIDSIFGFVNSFILPPAKEEKKDEKEFNLQKLTPGQKYVLEQMETKLSKLGFKTTYRFLYIGRKEAYKGSRVSTVIGMFKQLYANNMNTFTPYKATRTIAKGKMPWLFPSDKGFNQKNELYMRKKNLYTAYRNRWFLDHLIILNTEELATLYHLPGLNVKAPNVPRVDAKKGQPPVRLPMREIT